jgi:hypothetical protein
MTVGFQMPKLVAGGVDEEGLGRGGIQPVLEKFQSNMMGTDEVAKE